MSYCPRCGVETEKDIKKCPLCGIKLPEVPGMKDEDYQVINPVLFPKYSKAVIGDISDIKERVFYALTVTFLANIIYFFVMTFINSEKAGMYLLIILYILSGWFFLYLFSGFIRNKKIMIFCLFLNALFFTLLIDFSKKGLGWFFPVFVPLCIIGLIILIIVSLAIRFKKKKTFLLIFDIALSLSVYLVCIEAVISNYLKKRILLSWSVIFSLEIISTALFILFFLYKVPSKIKNKLKMKFHI